MHHRLKQEAIRLRIEKEFSYAAIRERLEVAKSTLSEWLQEFPLSRERILELKRAGWKKGEAKIELFRAAMREKRERKCEDVYRKYLERFKNLSEDSFFVAGLMLYLAEGSKKSSSRIALANTDVRIHKLFISWLQKFFGVPKREIKIHLQLYENMDIEKEMNFWKTELGLAHSQFYKPFVRELRPSSFSYRESFRHGTCTVMISGVEIYREIMMAIKAYLENAA